MQRIIGSSSEGSVSETIPEKKILGYQFTAEQTGNVEEITFKTNSTANTATSLILGICAEGATKPSTVLGEKTVSGTPGTSSLIKVTGLNISIISGTKYWLCALPLGGNIHFNLRTSGGTVNGIVTTTSISTHLESSGSWGTPTLTGPVVFEGIGVPLYSYIVSYPPTELSPKSLRKLYLPPLVPEKKKEEQRLVMII